MNNCKMYYASEELKAESEILVVEIGIIGIEI
jgi:hypothetical protein